MNKIVETQYCCKDFDYPKDAYLVYAILMDNEGTQYYYPLISIYTQLKQIKKDMYSIISKIKGKLLISSEVIIVPVHLEKLFPLDKKYWEKPIVHYTHADRVKLFGNVLEKYALYKLIVTPITQKKDVTFVSATTVFSNAEIHAFMLTSDFPVDHTAKYAGIYLLDKPFIYSWNEERSVKTVNMKKEEYVN